MRSNATTACLITAATVAGSGTSTAALLPSQVLLVWNSRSAQSQEIRNAYVAARPGVRELDLNDAAVAFDATTASPAVVSRAAYLSRIRGPIKSYLDGAAPGGGVLAERIVAIVTTRGLPAQIQGVSEFDLSSTWSSVESELTLLQQDLEAAVAGGTFTNRYSGVVANPYSATTGIGIDQFSRANVRTPRSFVLTSPGGYIVTGLTPGDIYLVTRLDAAPTAGATAAENVAALIRRGIINGFDPCGVRAVFDRWSCAPLDDDGLGVIVPPRDDFPNAHAALLGVGVRSTFDQTGAFLTNANLPPGGPFIAVGSYGTNHALGGCGGSPPGLGAYVSTGYPWHPAAFFVSYESWNGTSMIDGVARGGQGQVLDFISSGGSFTIGSVTEPFTFSVPRTELLAKNLLIGGMTFAEAAYTALPVLSWQWTPVGDPLATVRLGAFPCRGDANGDGVVDFADLALVLGRFGLSQPCGAGDLNRDGVVNLSDLNLVLSFYGGGCR